MSVFDAEFVRDEILRLNKKRQNVDAAVAAQDRLLGLNDSYRKRYTKYIEILVMLVFAGLAYLGIVMAQKQFTVVPAAVFDAVMLILLLYVAYYLFYAVIELMTRSAMNYDELELPPLYDASGSSVDYDKLKNEGKLGEMTAATGICQGQECCSDGLTWDSIRGQCIIPPESGFTTLDQAFPTGSLTMPSFQRSCVSPLQGTTSLSYGTL